MKFIALSLLAVVFSSEVSAQVRGPRYNPPGRTPTTRPAPTPSRPGTYPQPPVIVRDNGYRPTVPSYNPGPRVVGPRYNPPGRNVRIVRDVRRTPVIWNSGFYTTGYRCDAFDLIQVTSYNSIHLARFWDSYDCNQALRDLEIYGDYCLNDELYDRNGRLEAQFWSNAECRNALGYYY